MLTSFGRFTVAMAVSSCFWLGNADAAEQPILQALSKKPTRLADGTYYLPSTLETIRWGYLANKDSKPVLTIPSGSRLMIDSLSSEGMVEDSGRDPVKFFAKYGVPRNRVLNDQIEICASDLEHKFGVDGPHIITGPVAIEGAQPGDVLKVEMLSLVPRVPYGVIAMRHGRGVLAGEYPLGQGPLPGASRQRPELYGSFFSFIPVKKTNGKYYGTITPKKGRPITFALDPFPGTIGVGADTNEPVNSVPPSDFGGNMDLKELAAGSTLYLPVQVPQAMFYMGDPHFGQGDGEVSLTAVEGSLRCLFKLTLLKKGDPAIPGKGTLSGPFVETPEWWIPIGLDPSLDEAMKKTTRNAVQFLVDKQGLDPESALNYLSAASDFEISQAVDHTKGIHARIRKSDFALPKPLNRR